MLLAPVGELRAQASPGPVVNAEALTPILQAAVSRRVDVIGIGDSNQGHQGLGWDHGWQAALSKRYPMYATGWMGQGPTSIGYKYVCVGGLSTSGALPELDSIFDVDRSIILPRYAWQASGPTAQRVEFALESGVPLDVGATLVLRREIALFPSETYPPQGSFTEFARRADTYATLWATGALGTAAAGSGGAFLADTYELGIAPILPPDPARRGVQFEWYSGRQGQTDVVGPFFVGLSCIENADATAGFSYTTLVYAGGSSLRDMAFALQEARAQPMLVNMFQRVRARQPQPDKRVIFTINSGLNDREETLPSVGLNPLLPGNSVPAFTDNANATIATLLSAWNAAGGNDNEVYFILTGSHPVADADAQGVYPGPEGLLRGYRRAFADIALERPRTAAVILDALTTSAELLARGWYLYHFDKHHLKASGYEAIAARQLAAIEAVAGCWADLNVDRRIDIEDLYEFFSAPVDLNLDGASTNGDSVCLIRAVRSTEVDDLPL